MNIRVQQIINRAYYDEFYNEWLEHRSVYRKWQNTAGFVCVLLGIGVLFFGSTYRYLSMVLVVYGGYLMYDFSTSKKNWMKQRLESRVNDNNFFMIFREDEIISNGPFTKSESTWDYYSECIETNRGVFFVPENGISIYLQKKIFDDPEELKWVLGKMDERMKKGETG